MKNILNKIEFHYTYIIMAFGLVITGHFVNLIIFTSLIIIHEMGHIIISKIWKINQCKRRCTHFFACLFYKNTYFNINSTASTYMSMLTFFSFAFPVIRLSATYVITPIEIPSEML